MDTLNLTFPPNIYRPLEGDTSEHIITRAVYVLPDLDHEGHVRCTLTPLFIEREIQPYHLRRRHQYGALSYVWGTDIRCKPIELNGEICMVQENLHGFLSHVCRKKLFENPYWIDALCINQADIGERNRLVQHMGLIYSQARCVILWPGANANLSDLRKLVDIVALFRRFEYPDEVPFESCCREHGWTLDECVQAFNVLLKNEYWWRAWTQQEFQLGARNLQICTEDGLALICSFCGDVQIALREVINDHRDLESAEILELFSEGYTKFLTHAMLLQDTTQHLLFSPFILQCSDIRDRVYSQLALLGRLRSDFPVNYSESTFALYLRTLIVLSDDIEWPDLTVFHRLRTLALQLEIKVRSLHEQSLNARADQSSPRDILHDLDAKFIESQMMRPLHSWPTGACHTECPYCRETIKSFDRHPDLTNFVCCRRLTYNSLRDDKGLPYFHLSLAPSPTSSKSARQFYFHSEVVHGAYTQSERTYAGTRGDREEHLIHWNVTTCTWLIELLTRISDLKTEYRAETTCQESSSSCKECDSASIDGLNAIHHSHDLVGM